MCELALPGGQTAWHPSTHVTGQFRGSGCWQVGGQALPQALYFHSHSTPASLFNSSQLSAASKQLQHTLIQCDLFQEALFCPKWLMKLTAQVVGPPVHHQSLLSTLVSVRGNSVTETCTITHRRTRACVMSTDVPVWLWVHLKQSEMSVKNVSNRSNEHMAMYYCHLIVTVEYKCYQPHYCTPWRWYWWAHGRTAPPSPASPCLYCTETQPENRCQNM